MTKGLSVEVRTGRILANYHHGQNRPDLGKLMQFIVSLHEAKCQRCCLWGKKKRQKWNSVEISSLDSVTKEHSLSLCLIKRGSLSMWTTALAGGNITFSPLQQRHWGPAGSGWDWLWMA